MRGSVKYRGNQGIDLTFEGVGSKSGRFALAEAKAGSGLGELVVDTAGIKQGSYEFFRTRLARAIVYGDRAATPLYRSMYLALRSAKVDLYGGFGATDRLYKFDPVLFHRNVDFRKVRRAATRIR